MDYAREDPAAHLAEIAHAAGLQNLGVGLMTGVDVTHHSIKEDQGVRVTATVGLGAPCWAAAPDGHLRWADHPVGTINIVAELPVALADEALVNAVATVTEAKAQALWEAGIGATGTASDAVVILAQDTLPREPYGGPRSTWGARLARATHHATAAGIEGWRRGQLSWSERARRG
jgi:adenosylcobinamide amidohydrolase